jgi:hypothetical protein
VDTKTAVLILRIFKKIEPWRLQSIVEWYKRQTSHLVTNMDSAYDFQSAGVPHNNETCQQLTRHIAQTLDGIMAQRLNEDDHQLANFMKVRICKYTRTELTKIPERSQGRRHITLRATSHVASYHASIRRQYGNWRGGLAHSRRVMHQGAASYNHEVVSAFKWQ